MPTSKDTSKDKNKDKEADHGEEKDVISEKKDSHSEKKDKTEKETRKDSKKDSRKDSKSCKPSETASSSLSTLRSVTSASDGLDSANHPPEGSADVGPSRDMGSWLKSVLQQEMGAALKSALGDLVPRGRSPGDSVPRGRSPQRKSRKDKRRRSPSSSESSSQDGGCESGRSSSRGTTPDHRRSRSASPLRRGRRSPPASPGARSATQRMRSSDAADSRRRSADKNGDQHRKPHDISPSSSDNGGSPGDGFDCFLSDLQSGNADEQDAADLDAKIAAIAGFFNQESEATGPDVYQYLASTYDPLLRLKPNDENLTKLIKAYPRPANLGNLIVPSTNEAIYKKMRRPAQLVDIQAQKIQQILSKAMVIPLKLISLIASKENANKPLAEMLTEVSDILRLNTAAFSYLSQLRKELVRNELRGPVGSICSWDTPVPTMTLFSEEWSKQVKEKSGENRCFSINSNSSCHARDCDNDSSLESDYSCFAYESECENDYMSFSSVLDEAKQAAALKKSSSFDRPRSDYGRASTSRRSYSYGSDRREDRYERRDRGYGGSGYNKKNSKKGNYGKKASKKRRTKPDGESQVCNSNALSAVSMPVDPPDVNARIQSKLCNTPENFTGGKLASHIDEWEKLTSDPWILNAVRGYKLDLESDPEQSFVPTPLRLDPSEQDALDNEVLEFIKMGIVEDCPAFESDSYYSTLFTRPKEDGSIRVILNLKGLTSHMEKVHFKMETVRDVILMMRPNCNFSSIDFKHAFYSIMIDKTSRKYLRFIWRGRHLQFTCMPQGLGPASRVFTKLLKPILAHLRSLGIEISIYIDDSILIDDDESTTHEDDVEYAAVKFDKLGYTVNGRKSVFPTRGSRNKQIKHLGFIFNSVQMTVQLTDKKQSKIAEQAGALLSASEVTIQDLASFVGKLVATEPGFPHAPIYYKHIEIFKNEQIRFNRGNLLAPVNLTREVASSIRWWQDNVAHICRHVIVPKPSHFIESDSSDFAWGGCVNGISKARGPWSSEESLMHINVKELTASFFMLKTYCSDMNSTHIRLKMDNTTAVACVNRKASTKPELMRVTREMWLWALDRDITISAEYLPGRFNQVADDESRMVDNVDTEWMIKSHIFRDFCALLGRPDIDLFASRLNAQLENYVSYRPDPDARAVDSFMLDWTCFDMPYLFPPFSVIARVLSKVRREGVTAVMVLPIWPTQSWWPAALAMAVAQPYILPKHCLWMPQAEGMQHPLTTMRLAVLKISGLRSASEAYRTQSLTLSAMHGGKGPMSNIRDISMHGASFVVKGRLMNLVHL